MNLNNCAFENNSYIRQFMEFYLGREQEDKNDDWFDAALATSLQDTSPEELMAIHRNVSHSVEISQRMFETVDEASKYGLNASTWLWRMLKSRFNDDKNGDLRRIILEQDFALMNLNLVLAKYIGDHNVYGFDIDNDEFFADIENAYHQRYCKNDDKIDYISEQKMDYITYRLSQNVVASGLGTMALMAQMCMSEKMTRYGLNEKEKKLAFAGVKSLSNLGIRKAIVGALKAGASNGCLPLLSKATPNVTFAAIAYLILENTIVMAQYGKQEINAWEMINKSGRVSVTSLCVALSEAKGGMIGAGIGKTVGAKLFAAAIPAIPAICPTAFEVAGIFVAGTIAQKSIPLVYDRLVPLLNVSKQSFLNSCYVEQFQESSLIQRVMKKTFA